MCAYTQVLSLFPLYHNPMGRLPDTIGDRSGEEPIALSDLRGLGS